jgi:arylamine N-acetyltransferase
MNLPRLGSTDVEGYLAKLGRPALSFDLPGLTRLQRAHLLKVPFHNLALLADLGHEPRMPALEAAVEGNLAGLGGSAFWLTPAFVALLRTLGFQAWLAAASVDAPGDHCVGIVQLPEGRFAVDVGLGQPCLRPFPLLAEASVFTAYGQSFRFEAQELGNYRLQSVLPGGQLKTLYRLHPEPRAYSSFEAPRRGRLDRSANGLEAIHAARMTEWAWAAVENGVYHRFAGGLTNTRTLLDWEAAASLLHTTFALPEELIQRALATVRQGAPRPRTRDAPCLQFILSMAVTHRAESARALLRSLDEQLRSAPRPRATLGVLLLDNSQSQPGGGGALDEVLKEIRGMGMRAACVAVRDSLDRLAPFQRSGLLPASLCVPLPIGACRTLQAVLLHEHLRTACLGLPHPEDGGGPVTVWMLDDDLEFRRLSETQEGLQLGPGENLLCRAEHLWAHHPEVSVVLGTYTGEPPIPGYATLQVQLRDLAGNLSALGQLAPGDSWRPAPAPRHLRDYYYDHAQGSEDHLLVAFPWSPPVPAPWKVRQAFVSLCTAFARVPHGHQVTRPLTYTPAGTLTPSRNRGGNALFLDLDALVVAPYPVFGGADGLMTRRADTLWAHLAAREPTVRIVQADMDLLHGRQLGDGSSPLTDPQPDTSRLRRFVEGQERGIVLARLLARERPLEPHEAAQEIAVRRGLLARSQHGARQELAHARQDLTRPEAWWWQEPEAAASAQECLTTLERVERLLGALDALEDSSLPEQLAGFARHVLDEMPSWRAAWA